MRASVRACVRVWNVIREHVHSALSVGHRDGVSLSYLYLMLTGMLLILCTEGSRVISRVVSRVIYKNSICYKIPVFLVFFNCSICVH